MKTYRVYDAPCGELVCSIYGEFNSLAEVLATARQSAWICEQLGDEAVAFECEEVLEW